MSPPSPPGQSTPPAITSIDLLKQHLFDGNKSLPQLCDQLSDLLRVQEFRNFVLGLESLDLEWFIDLLDNFLSAISDPTSHAFQGFLHELKDICGAREILPEDCTIPGHLLNVDHRDATGRAREGMFKGSKVWIKPVVKHDVREPRKARETFYQMSVLWRHSSHPNIVPLLGCTTSPLQFVSERMPGGNLTTYTANHPNTDRFSLLSDVAEGLNYLHSWDVVHGNLKGPNVLVDDNGHARITDFGLAPVTRSPDFIQNIDQDHGVQWTAPEILNGQGTYSKETDVFSFAMVAIEAFTDSTPFGNKQPHAVLSEVLEGKRPPRPTHSSFTDWFWTLLQHCWDSEASQRLQVSQILQVLHQLGRSAWNRLITSSLTPSERASLITTIFSDRDEVEGVISLCENDAQAFIDVLDQMLDDPTMPLRKKCLKILCKICGNQALLPSSLQIPLCYDPSGRALYSGGYADVWKGQHQGYGVAVKVLRVYSTSDFEKIKSKFCREVVTWRALRHPNVLQLLGATMTDRKFAMTSKWMTNGNVTEFLERHKDADRFKLLKGVANGLIYLHSQAMIHGDLKGANILVDEDGNALLADFGLLTLVSDPTNPTASNSYTSAGTTRWMSPELLDPDQFGPKDGRPTKESDRYALGMVVYEVLSGKFPFAPYRDYVVMRKVIEGERPERPQGEEGARFTDYLWQTLQQCWTQEPTGRPGIEVILGCLGPAPRGQKPHPTVSIPANLLTDSPSPLFDEPPEIIIEALRTKLRPFVLRLGGQMEALINERGTRIVVNPATTYERLLVHRCSAYYGLSCENSTGSKDIMIYRIADSKIPPRRIAALVPFEETAQITSSVARRVQKDRSDLKSASQSDSIADEDDRLPAPGRPETKNHRDRSNAADNRGHRKRIDAGNEARALPLGSELRTNVREPPTSTQASTSNLMKVVKDSGSVPALATGSSWSGPITPSREQSVDTAIPAHPSWPPDHEGSPLLLFPSPHFSYPSPYGPPPPSSDEPRYLGYSSMGDTDAYMYAHYPPPPGQAMGQGAVPQHPYYQPYSYQPQRFHSDPTGPSMDEPTFYPPPNSQSQQLPYSSQSMQSDMYNNPPPPQPTRTQTIIPTLGKGGDDHPGWSDPSPYVPSQDSRPLNPRDLYVKNLDASITSNALFTYFRPYGLIVGARIMRSEAGESRGFGFVSFETPDQASAAVRAMNGAFLQGKQIIVRFHEPKPQHQGKTPESQRPVPGSYYQAAVSENPNLELHDSLAAVSPAVRREVISGELTTRIKRLGIVRDDEVEPIASLIANLSLSEVVSVIQDPTKLAEHARVAKLLSSP